MTPEHFDDPHGALADAERGYELVREGRLEAAAEFLLAAEAGGVGDAAFELGHLYEDLDRIEDAARAYERAVAAGDGEARVDLGNLYADELGRPAEAEAFVPPSDRRWRQRGSCQPRAASR